MDYPIYQGLATQSLDQYLKDHSYSNVLILVDEHTVSVCYPLIQDILPEHHVLEIQSGEIHKEIQTCIDLWKSMTQIGVDRNALMINLGGGVIGDMGGFVASTYKRGIDFVQVPTTLLAQVDASVGGKLGIDFDALKNQIGLFQNPKAVFIDTVFLKTLPQRQLMSGFAELIKHALISDISLWRYLQDTPFEALDWSTMIQKAVKIKNDIVTQDPFDQGIRKTLNFGHTVGHALESYLINDPHRQLLHGEAVAQGIVLECIIATNLGLMLREDLLEVEAFVKQHYAPIILGVEDIQPLLALIRHDKKNTDKMIKMALVDMIGQATYDIVVYEEIIVASIQDYIEHRFF